MPEISKTTQNPQKSSLYFFICNHWTEGGLGYAFPSGWFEGEKYERGFSSVYTIEKMLDAADKYPSVLASMEIDAYAYEVLSEIAPATIRRLKEYIKQGKASPEGGTYAQPLGQDYGWEFNVRQLTLGRSVIKEILDYDVKSFLVEEQWFHPQMPQLLLNSGFSYASLQNQNSGQVMPMNKSMINWVGIDGSKLPTIPANNIMVSCVRQYTDYTSYMDRLFNSPADYPHPLLFQWVEIWTPGMDWGASVDPFEKALNQVHEWGATPVTLDGYFEHVKDKLNLENIYIPLDKSNYRNDWYQDGGWGYNGDKIMIENRISEHNMMAIESFGWFLQNENMRCHSKKSIKLWKDILILQNHDVSVARGYPAHDENGMRTDADSYVIKKLRDFRKECSDYLDMDIFLGDDKTEFTVVNYTGFSCFKEVIFELKNYNGEQISLFLKDEEIPHTINKFVNKHMISFCDNFDGFSSKRYSISKKDTFVQSATPEFALDRELITETDNISVSWIPGKWDVEIRNKKTGAVVFYKAFSGGIGKMNEHALLYPSLSSAHETFIFAFDGEKHCPDQCSGMYIKGAVTKESQYESVLELSCPLVTLHTTDTPVAFCRATVSINHLSGDVKCHSYLYTSVPLNVSASACFNHNFENAKYIRDFPFGEEETEIDSIYANNYLRVQGKNDAFTLMNYGVQKIDFEENEHGDEIKCKVSKSKLHFEYNWDFTLRFDTKTSSDSLKMVKELTNHFVTQKDIVPQISYSFDNEKIFTSTHYSNESGHFIRFVNYSDENQKGNLDFRNKIIKPFFCDFEENKLADLPENSGTIALDLKPWEIKTICFNI